MKASKKVTSVMIIFLLTGTGAILGIFDNGFRSDANREDPEFLTISSPNGDLDMEIYVPSSKGKDGYLYYNINYFRNGIMSESKLGLNIPDIHSVPYSRISIREVSYVTKSDNFILPLAERSSFNFTFNEINIQYIDRSRNNFNIIIRAYDGGIAFRYVIPEDFSPNGTTISSELTSFRFKENLFGYSEYGTEGIHKYSSINSIGSKCEIPFTMNLNGKGYLSINEGHLDDYSRMYVRSDKNLNNTLNVNLDSSVKIHPSFHTPWRVLVFGQKPGDLIENGQILYSLCPPNKIGDTSWIKGGKSFRDTTLSTNGSKNRIDFIAENNMQFLLLDASWYGPEWTTSSDATTVIPKDLDMDQVIEYGRKRGIGVFLYINKNAMVRQMDEMFPLYEEWGIKGVKFGFIDGRTQSGINFIHKAVVKAAEHHLLVNIHDNYRPTGMSRTYPNLLTQEGIRGNEQDPLADNNVLIPYTRMICGAADYTPKLPSYHNNNTRIHQLALPIIIYSPLNTLYWHQAPDVLQELDEKELWKFMPTVWNDSIFPGNELGKNAICARKSNEDWFVGAIVNSRGGNITIPLDFLDNGVTYKMRMYKDGRSGDVLIEDYLVDSEKTIKETLLKNGGICLYIVKDFKDGIGYDYSFRRCDPEPIVLEQDTIKTFSVYHPNGGDILPVDLSGMPNWVTLEIETGILTIDTHDLDPGTFSGEISILVDSRSKEIFLIDITVVNKNDPPGLPNIESPSKNLTICEIDLIDLKGSCSDPDFNDIGNAESLSYNWYSSLDGHLGEGEYISDINLSIGEHVITLKVNDMGGLESSEIIIVSVLPLDQTTILEPLPTRLLFPEDGDTIYSNSLLLSWSNDHQYPLLVEYKILFDTVYPPENILGFVKGSTEFPISNLSEGMVYYYSIKTSFLNHEIDNCSTINSFLFQLPQNYSINFENISLTGGEESVISIEIGDYHYTEGVKLMIKFKEFQGFNIEIKKDSFSNDHPYFNFTICSNESLVSKQYKLEFETWLEDLKGNRYQMGNETITIYLKDEQLNSNDVFSKAAFFGLISLLIVLSILVISKRRKKEI